MPQPTFRDATARDAPAVADVLFAATYHDALRAGLPPVVADMPVARAVVAGLLRLDPFGGVVAVVGDAVVGVGWSQARGRVATIGPLAVAPAWRGRGAGTALLARLLDRVGQGAAQVRLLDPGTAAGGLAIALRTGFRVVAPVLELVLPPGCPCVAADLADGTTVRPATSDDRWPVIERDARSFGARREPDVDAAMADGRTVVAERAGRVVGYALGQDLGGALLVGSAGADDPAAVMAMVARLAEAVAVAERGVRVLVPAVDQRLVDLALLTGFRIERLRAYLTHGGGTAPPRAYLLMPLGRC